MNGNTVQDLINAAYRSFGYLGRGAALSAADSYDAFEALNDMIDECNNDRLLIYEIRRDVFPLTPNTQVYTLGTGGVFNMPRPPKIERASVLLTLSSPQQEIPIEVLDDTGWQNITLKVFLSLPHSQSRSIRTTRSHSTIFHSGAPLLPLVPWSSIRGNRLRRSLD